MDSTIIIDWAFSLADTIRNTARDKYPEEMHRWPINNNFESKGFSWDNKYLVIVLYDKGLQIPQMGSIENWALICHLPLLPL
jgi:hypothetical protein